MSADGTKANATSQVSRWEVLRQRGEQIQQSAQQHAQQQKDVAGGRSVVARPPAPPVKQA